MKITGRIIFSVIFSFILILYEVTSLTKIITTHAPDFSVYYGAAGNIVHHINPYTDAHQFTKFGYPLMTAFFFVPFLLFPYKIAQGLFVIISFIAFLFCIILSLKLTKQVSFYRFLFFSSFGLFSFPVKFTFGMGQINLIAYAFLLGGFLFYLHQKEKYAILLTFIAIILKPILLFMLIFFLFRRSWHIVLGVGGLLFILTLTGFVFYPKEMHHYMIFTVPSLFALAGREVYYNQGIMGFVARLTSNFLLRTLFSRILEILVLGMTLIGATKTKNTLLSFSLFLPSLVLIDSLSWQHHFIFLLFPWIVVCHFILSKKISKRWFFPLGLSYLLVSFTIAHPENFLQFPYVLLLSNTFYGAVILLLTLIGLTFFYRE